MSIIEVPSPVVFVIGCWLSVSAICGLSVLGCWLFSMLCLSSEHLSFCATSLALYFCYHAMSVSYHATSVS